jgi:DNA repair protein RadC
MHERPRERLRHAGASALSTRELLSLLVGSGTRGGSAAQVAGELVRVSEGSLRRLASMLERGTVDVPGVGPAVASRVAAALELGRRLAREGPRSRPQIQQAHDVYTLCSPYLRDLPQEEFRVLLLDTRNRVERELLITRGTVDTSLVHAREVFRAAVVENAASLILVHNHPSGDPSPSPEDRAITRQLAEASQVIGVPILDHVIIGDGRYLSFAEAGLLARR